MWKEERREIRTKEENKIRQALGLQEYCACKEWGALGRGGNEIDVLPGDSFGCSVEKGHGETGMVRRSLQSYSSSQRPGLGGNSRGPSLLITSHLPYSSRISDIRLFIVDARPAMAATSFVLMTTFPNKELADENQTLKEANLLNAVIVQRLT